ncbi:MAG: hypothetical protein WBP93_14290 [Pyrinomonadaceae bacterium]
MALMRLKILILLGICIVVGCAQSQSQSDFNSSRREATIQRPSTQEPPPTPSPTPAEDTERYVEWMKKRGTPINDKPHENVSLRIGDWGFFYHGDRPVGSWQPLLDKVALDRSGHAVTEAENGDWYALLSINGLDAAGALKRVAWLFNSEGLDPASATGGAQQARITAPTLTTRNGVITFQGWWEAYSDPPYNRRITIVATKDRTKLVIDSGEKP